VSGFSWGQRFAIRVIAFLARHTSVSRVDLRIAFDRGFRHRPEEERLAMWRAAMERARGLSAVR